MHKDDEDCADGVPMQSVRVRNEFSRLPSSASAADVFVQRAAVETPGNRQHHALRWSVWWTLPEFQLMHDGTLLLTDRKYLAIRVLQ